MNGFARRSALVTTISAVRSGRRALAALAIALLSALAWGAPAASADEASTIIERCTHGESLAGFSFIAYVAALAQLPSAVREYTDCEQLIRAAELTAIGPPPTAPPATPAPAPMLGRTEIARVLSGAVTVRLKGTHEFAVLGASTTLPDGSEVDATDGRVSITVARPAGGVQSAEATGGRFVIHQSRGGAGETRFTLSLPLSGCRQHRRAHARGSTARRIWVTEHGGSWGTDGRYVSTSAHGTRWLTLDECSRSLVKVAQGRVQVRDLLRKLTRTVTAGRSYTAGQATPRRR